MTHLGECGGSGSAVLSWSWRRRMGHYCETCDAMSWQFFRAASICDRPAMTAENCWVHWLPTSWNWGMPTYCTPGSPGRFVVPGLLMGAAAIESSVGLANAAAAFL